MVWGAFKWGVMPYISYEAYMGDLEADKFCVRLTWPIASLGPSDWTPTEKQYIYVYTLYIYVYIHSPAFLWSQILHPPRSKNMPYVRWGGDDPPGNSLEEKIRNPEP